MNFNHSSNNFEFVDHELDSKQRSEYKNYLTKFVNSNNDSHCNLCLFSSKPKNEKFVYSQNNQNNTTINDGKLHIIKKVKSAKEKGNLYLATNKDNTNAKAIILDNKERFNYDDYLLKQQGISVINKNDKFKVSSIREGLNDYLHKQFKKEKLNKK